MIKINLLDPSEIPKEKGSVVNEMSIPTSLGSSSVAKVIKISSIVAVVLYVIILLYYFFGIHSSVTKLEEDVADTNSAIKKLAAGVLRVEEGTKELIKLQGEVKEYEGFIFSKKNWAAVLNALSDELTNDILFERISVSKSTIVRKVKTDKGLVTVKDDVILLTISIVVPEQADSQITAYMKKLKRNSFLKDKLVELKNTGLILRQKEYQTQLNLYFSILNEPLEELKE